MVSHPCLNQAAQGLIQISLLRTCVVRRPFQSLLQLNPPKPSEWQLVQVQRIPALQEECDRLLEPMMRRVSCEDPLCAISKPWSSESVGESGLWFRLPSNASDCWMLGSPYWPDRLVGVLHITPWLLPLALGGVISLCLVLSTNPLPFLLGIEEAVAQTVLLGQLRVHEPLMSMWIPKGKWKG